MDTLPVLFLGKQLQLWKDYGGGPHFGFGIVTSLDINGKHLPLSKSQSSSELHCIS